MTDEYYRQDKYEIWIHNAGKRCRQDKRDGKDITSNKAFIAELRYLRNKAAEKGAAVNYNGQTAQEVYIARTLKTIRQLERRLKRIDIYYGRNALDILPLDDLMQLLIDIKNKQELE